METGYQRGKIQEESLHYETLKHTGEHPIIGVNTFVNPKPDQPIEIELQRSTEAEKVSQIERLHQFQQKHKTKCGPMLNRLKQVATDGGNVFSVLMEAVRVCSMGQITHALFESGGQYRRSM